MKSLFCFVAFVVIAAFQTKAQSTYEEITVDGGGVIRGTVKLMGAWSASDQMEITKDEAICGRTKNSPALVLGKGNGVKDAVITVEGITQGKGWATEDRFVLDQQACEYVPHVLVVPVGARLEIVNSDPILHNVHAYEGEKDQKTVFNIAQPIKNQRTVIPQSKLKTPGVMFAVCDAGHPWMTAYVIVAEHPYYAVTDQDGRFTIKDIPEGTYSLRMWHEGVKIIGRELERGKVKKYRFEEPYTERKSVVVQKGKEQKIDFELVLR